MEDRIKERAYYMYRNGMGYSDEDRYLKAKIIQEFVEGRNDIRDVLYDNNETLDNIIEDYHDGHDDGLYDFADYIEDDDSEHCYCYICGETFRSKPYYACHDENEYVMCKECFDRFIEYNLDHKVFTKKDTYETAFLFCPCVDLYDDEDYEEHGEITDYHHKLYFKDYVDEARFNDVKERNNVRNMVKCVDCPIVNCPGQVKDDHCQTCHAKVCHGCLSTAHEGDCADNIEIISYIEDNITAETATCPMCDFLVIKDGGCDSLFCWNCGNYFNWHTKKQNKIVNNPDVGKYETKNFYKEYVNNKTRWTVNNDVFWGSLGK